MTMESTAGRFIVTAEELDRDPDGVLRKAEQSRVTICEGGVPVAYVVAGDEWREMLGVLQRRGIAVIEASFPLSESEE